MKPTSQPINTRSNPFRTITTETASTLFNFRYSDIDSRRQPTPESLERGRVRRRREDIEAARDLGQELLEVWED